MARVLRFVLAAAAVAALAAVPVHAKGPAEGRLCGVAGCLTLHGWEELRPFTSWWDTSFTQRTSPRPAPFFRVVVRQATPDPTKSITWTLLYVPSRNALRITQSRVPPYESGIGPYWRAIPATARAGLRRATASLNPYPGSSGWRTR